MSIGRSAENARGAMIGGSLRAENLYRHAPTLLLASAGAVLWAAIYRDTMFSLVHRWNTDENYSHGYLVPFVSLYLAWQSLESRSSDRLPSVRGGVLPGAACLLLAMLLSVATVVVPTLIGESASMLLALAGLALLVGGWEYWRHLWAPIAFLIFLVPWPSEIYSRAAFPLQLVVSRIASGALEVAGIPVLREGNLIHMPGQTMHVAQACSGMRQLTAFLAITACAALLVRRPIWYRLVVLASSIPIAILVNALRVTATGLVMHHIGAEWTTGALHTVEGLVMIVLGLAFLWAEVQILDWILDRPGLEQSNRCAEAR